MESYKRRPDFAEMQIRNLLKELNGKNHNNKVKALKKYQEYIDEFYPEIYDDDVDMLLMGILERDEDGLLYWGGVESEKHKGALKRICPHVMALLCHLVNIDFGDEFENIFFERFIRLPLEELDKLNFVAHVTEATKSMKAKGPPSALVSNIPLNNVCQLISLQLRDHIDMETDQSDPLELVALLGSNDAITEVFMAWLQLSATNDISIDPNVSSERKKQIAIERVKLVRPACWADVEVSDVPVQPDEDGYGDEEDVDHDAHRRPVSDPLGLVTTDLREIQSIHIGDFDQEEVGGGDNSRDRARSRSRSRGTSNAPQMNQGKRSSAMKGSDMFNLMKKIRLNTGGQKKTEKNRTSSDASAVDSSSTHGGSSALKLKNKSNDVGWDGGEADGAVAQSRAVSILPTDRAFKPGLFLALVHNKASMADLETGLSNLQVLLDQQSNMRENLVRLHLGHFINCVDSIAWLKNYQFENPTEISYEESLGKRRERKKLVSANSSEFLDVDAPSLPGASSIGRRDGEKMASHAVLKLEVAKKKALDTLAPILNSMKRSRQIKATDSILKRFANALDFPHLMQVALDKKDYEEVVRLNSRIKTMPNSVNQNIRTNIQTKANQIVAQMKKALTADALRNYSFLSVDEVLRLFKNIAEIDTPSDYQIVLETCFDRQHGLFLKRYTDIGKACDDELVKTFSPEQSAVSYDSPCRESSVSTPMGSPRSVKNKRTSNDSTTGDGLRLDEPMTGGFRYIESDDDEDEGSENTDIFYDPTKPRDESTVYSGIRTKYFKRMIAEIRSSFPILSCMVTLLEASSVAGAMPVDALLGATSAVPGPDMLQAGYTSGNNLMGNSTNNLMSAPAALLKGMDVAYGRRHGGASKFANMLGMALQKYGVVLKRLVEGFPEEVLSIVTGASSATSTSSSATPAGQSSGSPSKKGLWSRIDELQKVTTPTIEEAPIAAPTSTMAAMLFAQGSGDAFGAAGDASSSAKTTTQQEAMSMCREAVVEPYLSFCVRLLSETLDGLEAIISPSLGKAEDGGVGAGIWLGATAVSLGEISRPTSFLPRNNPYYTPILSLRDVVLVGQQTTAEKALKVLEEAATRLMLSQEANQAIEAAQAEANGGFVGRSQDLEDENAALLRQDNNMDGAAVVESPIYDVSALLHKAEDSYKDTYASARVRPIAASVIPPSLLNPELTSFNDNNNRTSVNDDNNLNKYGASLETKAYQLEYMIVHMLLSLHGSLCCPELVSQYVRSSVQMLFSQFISDLGSSECPVLDAIGGYNDVAGYDAGLFGATRSTISIDLEMIELDLKVDGGVGDKNALIDGWYLDQIRACLAVRSLIVRRVCMMMSVLFPRGEGDEDWSPSNGHQQGVAVNKRTSLANRRGGPGGRRMSLSNMKTAASSMLLKGNSSGTGNALSANNIAARKRGTALQNVLGKGQASLDTESSPGLFDAGEMDSTCILAYLKEAVLHESNETVSAIVVEVCGVEDAIVQRYLEVQTLKLRTSIQASYSVVVKSELANKWGQSTRQALINEISQEMAFSQRVLPSSRVPACLARVLFEMSLQRTELTKALGWMTISDGLLTPAPNAEIAAALMAAQHKQNDAVGTGAGVLGTTLKENDSPAPMLGQAKAEGGGGWRGRISRKLHTGKSSKQIDGAHGPGSERNRAAITSLEGNDDSAELTSHTAPIDHAAPVPKYEEFLFCALCVSLLDVYTELIEELATSTFSVQSTGKKVNVRRMSSVASPPPPAPIAPKRRSNPLAVGAPVERNERVLSSMPGGYGADSQHPKSLGRAAEEYVFLKTAIQPLLQASSFEAPVNVTIISAADGCSKNANEDYPCAEELASATKIYIECFKRDRNLL